jgi:hypothetical protein
MTRAGAALALSAGVLLACASPEEEPAAPDQPDPDQVIELTGRVTVTGSAPLTILVLVTETDHYEIVGDLASELRNLQQLHVTVRGRVVREAAGPGFPAQLQVDSYTRVRDAPST